MEVLYTCPLVPAEWIAAHGLQPRCLAPPARTDERAGAFMGVCAYAEAFLDLASAGKDAAVIFTSRCDQMRRAADCARQQRPNKVFLMNLPATWQTPAARELHRAELERLGRFLVRLGGTPPTDDALREIMIRYDQCRQDLRAQRPHWPGRMFAEAMMKYHQEGTAVVVGPKDAPHTVAPSARPSPPRGEREYATRIPVALVGGPLLAEHFDLLDWIEAAGGAVALNATLHGERSLPAPFDARLLALDPPAALVGAYFDLPDVFHRPNTRLYQWLRGRIAERGVKGILVWHYSWCDLWRVEIQRLREQFALPVLELDAGDCAGPLPQLKNRVQAFLEMLAA